MSFKDFFFGNKPSYPRGDYDDFDDFQEPSPKPQPPSTKNPKRVPHQQPFAKSLDELVSPPTTSKSTPTNAPVIKAPTSAPHQKSDAGAVSPQNLSGMPPLNPNQPYYAKLYTPAYAEPPKPLIQDKDIIVFIVENSYNVFKYKDKILDIISKIISSNKSNLFLFLKTDNTGEYSALMDSTDVLEKNYIENILCSETYNQESVLPKALFNIKKIFKRELWPTFSFKESRCTVSSFSIICIGSVEGIDYLSSQRVITNCIEDIKHAKELKSFKYFCIKDTDAINAAALGFPIIGHIVSNFYE